MDNRALGKGLSALIPEKKDVGRKEVITLLKASDVKNNSVQPRTNYDQAKLDELKASIKEKGLLQPILVREKNGSYEVIAGERRLRAARELNLEEIPVVIKNVDDQEALVLALIENIQREELNAIEEAEAYKKLIEEFQFSQDHVAQSVGKDRSTISNLLRLLKLPSEIQKSLYDGQLTMGHARALLAIESSPEQKRLFDIIVKKGISVRELENLVKSQSKKESRRAKTNVKLPHFLALEEGLQKLLGTKVRINTQKKRGQISIDYYSTEDLERIIKIIIRN